MTHPLPRVQKLIERLPGPMTERTTRQQTTAINGHQHDYDFGFLWFAQEIRHFSSTANLKYPWRKNIRIREKSVYTKIETIRIQKFSDSKFPL